MKALLSISLVLAIIAPGEPLRCYSCGGYSLNPRRCTMKEKEPCRAKQTICMSGVMYSNMIRSIVREIQYASCIQPGNFKPGDYSLTSADNKYFQYIADSCTTDYCNTIPEVPNHMELPLNGLQCPACFANGTGVCESENIVNCHQNETMCIDFAGTLRSAQSGPTNITLKGCATEKFCRLAKGFNYIVKNMLIVAFSRKKCVAAQESLSELSSEE